MDRFDLKLIPEFDGFPTGPSVVEWFKKAEHICKLFRIKEPILVIRECLHSLPVAQERSKPGQDKKTPFTQHLAQMNPSLKGSSLGDNSSKVRPLMYTWLI